MTEDTSIREATEQDAKEIARIELLSFRTPWSEEMILSEMREPLSTFFVAVFQNNVIGYYGFLHILDELHILNVAVDPTFRQKGTPLQDAGSCSGRKQHIFVHSGNG